MKKALLIGLLMTAAAHGQTSGAPDPAFSGAPGVVHGNSDLNPVQPMPAAPGEHHIQSIPDTIQGNCETSTGGPIPFTIPCRDLEVILMQGTSKHEVARTNLDPQGRFTFGGLHTGVYALVIRSLKQKYESRMEGLKPGNSYTITPDIPDKKQ